MLVKPVDTILTTNTAGQVVESIPVLPSENPVQRADGSWVDPIDMVEDEGGAPIRIVDQAVVTNSVGQPVAAVPGKGLNTVRIELSSSTVPEDASIGDAIGALSVANGSGSYTFSITSDPDSKFSIDGNDLEVAAALDYDTATSHSVTIEADNGVDDPISRTFTISVTEVEAPTIAAPLDVTWVDGTNPVECVMNVTRPTYPGAIAAGDIPQVRYNGGGTIYSGTAIVDPQNDNPDFSGAGLPTQPAGAGYAQYRFVRDPGGPDEITGDWSSASEGAFNIAGASKSYRFLGAAESEQSTDSQTLEVNLEEEAADRFVVVFATVQNAPDTATVTAAGTEIDELYFGSVTDGYDMGIWGGLVPTGANLQDVVVAWATAAYEVKMLSVWEIRGISSPVLKDFDHRLSVADITVDADPGDFLFLMQYLSAGGPNPMTGSTEDPTRVSAITGDANKGTSADWTVQGSHAPFTVASGSAGAITIAAVCGEA